VHSHLFCLSLLAYFASLCVCVCMQSVKQKSFDHISAIYNLLVDKLEKQHHHHMLQHPQLTSITATIPSYSYPQRKASITTGNLLASKLCQKRKSCHTFAGVVDRNQVCDDDNYTGSPLVSMPHIPTSLLLNDSQLLEKVLLTFNQMYHNA
jgi:hypothetical protein